MRNAEWVRELSGGTSREKSGKWSNPMTKTALAQIQEYVGKRRNAPSRVRLGKRGLATWQRRVA